MTTKKTYTVPAITIETVCSAAWFKVEFFFPFNDNECKRHLGAAEALFFDPRLLKPQFAPHRARLQEYVQELKIRVWDKPKVIPRQEQEQGVPAA